LLNAVGTGGTTHAPQFKYDVFHQTVPFMTFEPLEIKPLDTLPPSLPP
jgi:hypothetical protein